MRYLRALALLLVVSACAVDGVSADSRALIACRAYDGALRSLAGYRATGNLSAGQIETVDQWRPVLNDACTGEATTADILSQIEQGVFELLLIEEMVQ